MFVTPVDIPNTMPDADPTVPMAVLLLAHVPPVDASLSVVVNPTHAFGVPVMAASGETDTLAVT